MDSILLKINIFKTSNLALEQIDLEGTTEVRNNMCQLLCNNKQSSDACVVSDTELNLFLIMESHRQMLVSGLLNQPVSDTGSAQACFHHEEKKTRGLIFDDYILCKTQLRIYMFFGGDQALQNQGMHNITLFLGLYAISD